MKLLAPRYAIAALAALGVALSSVSPANASIPQAQGLASAECSFERKVLGKRAFASLYAKGVRKRLRRAYAKRGRKVAAKRQKRRLARVSMRRCLRGARRRAHAAITLAVAECRRDLRRYGSEEFRFSWGTFDACVAYLTELAMEGGWDEEPYRPN